MYYKQNYKQCAHCGEYSGKYELCNECYHLAQQEDIIKNEQNKWVKNVRKNNKYKFYDENKKYYLKENILNDHEMRFFDIIRSTIKSKYLIQPQINLQSIIETDSNKRNDELFRNIDFALFYAEEYKPFLMIELNGKQHYNNEYWKERDKSIKAILNDVKIPLLTIDIQDLKEMEDNQIYNLMKKVISYLNPSFFKRLFGKKVNKMDLSWTEELIKNNKQEK